MSYKPFVFELQSHFVVIVLYDKNPNDFIKKIVYKDMTPEIRLKYNWFFKYRAALLQVQNPRLNVDLRWGTEKATGKSLEHQQRQNAISLKAKITKATNKLNEFKKEFEQYKANYSELFPIDQQTKYQMYINSISLAESKIQQLKNEQLPF
jgi:hypothetical protein